MNISIHDLDLTKRSPTLIEELMGIWEHSVRATHTFLTEHDIQKLKPLVRQGLQNLPKLFVALGNNNTVYGFMAVEDHKIAMLFIAPEQRRHGIGSTFVKHAVKTLGVNMVDANEQNPQAIRFYKKMGFSIVKRSPTDEQGKPFPIVHLRLE